MAPTMKSKNKLEWATNYRAWKARIHLILAMEDLLEILHGKVSEPIDDEEKEKYKKYDIIVMSLIVDSIKDHLIPYISKLDTSKKMFVVLTGLYIINNIGQFMSLRNELRDIRMTNNDTMAS